MAIITRQRLDLLDASATIATHALGRVITNELALEFNAAFVVDLLARVLDVGKTDPGVDLDGNAVAEGGRSFDTHLVKREARA